jgi:hypothetical protein
VLFAHLSGHFSLPLINIANPKQSNSQSTRWDKELNRKGDATSYYVLINWIQEARKCARYKGEDGSGATKAVIHGELVAILKREGIFS